MNLRTVDLNLLVIFDALITERSISRAARRIGVTPSAISHALRRLRDTFHDTLVEHTPEGMVPTRRALDLHRRVRGALAEISRAVDQQLDFDPATTERTFTIGITDYVTNCLLPRLCTRIRREAPSSTLIVEYLAAHGQTAEPGEIQLRVYAGPCGPDYSQHRLLQSRVVVAMRGDHPAAREAMTIERFSSLPHLRVSSATIGSKMVDDALARRGMSRWVALTVPTLAAVPPLLKHTDLCAVLPQMWFNLYCEPDRIAAAPLPLPEIEFTIDMIWQKFDDADAGHRWLRNLIRQETELLFSLAELPAKRPEDEPDFQDRLPVAADAM